MAQAAHPALALLLVASRVPEVATEGGGDPALHLSGPVLLGQRMATSVCIRETAVNRVLHRTRSYRKHVQWRAVVQDRDMSTQPTERTAKFVSCRYILSKKHDFQGQER